MATSTTFTLTAQNGHGTAVMVATVTVGPGRTITGRVVQPNLAPAAGVTVYVPGHATVVTGTDGAFSFDGLGATYDVGIAVGNHVVWYAGVSRADPTLEIALPKTQGAYLQGTISGGAYCSVMLTAWTQQSGFCLGVQQSVNYALGASWATGTNANIAIDAIGFCGTATLMGFGRTAFVASNGGNPVTDFALAPISTDFVSGNVTLASNWVGGVDVHETMLLGTGHANAVEQAVVPNRSQATGGGPWAMGVPVVSGARYLAHLEAYGNNGTIADLYRVSTVPATTVDFDVPAPPTLLLPTSGTVVSAGQLFSFSPVAGTVSMIRIVPQAALTYALPSAPPELDVVIAGDSAVLPDPSALGFNLATGSWQWTLRALGPHTTMDDVTGPDGLTAPGDSLRIESGPLFFTIP